MADLARVRRRIMVNSLRKQRVFRDRLNPLEWNMTEHEIKSRFRFFRPTIYFIFGLIKPLIERPTRRSVALPPLMVLCIALRFYAEGLFYLALTDHVRIS